MQIIPQIDLKRNSKTIKHGIRSDADPCQKNVICYEKESKLTEIHEYPLEAVNKSLWDRLFTDLEPIWGPAGGPRWDQNCSKWIPRGY